MHPLWSRLVLQIILLILVSPIAPSLAQAPPQPDNSGAPEIRFTRGHPHEINFIRILDGGKKVLSSGNDGEYILWDVENAREIERHDVRIRSKGVLAVSPDGTHALFEVEDKKVAYWNISTWTPEFEIEGNHYRVYCLAFSPDGKLAAIGRSRAEIQLVDLETRETIQSFKFQADDVRFSKDGNELRAITQWQPHFKAWDIKTGEEIVSFKPGVRETDSMVLGPEGRRVMFVHGKSMTVVDPFSGETLLTVSHEAISEKSKVDFSLDGRYLLHWAYGQHLVVLDAETGDLVGHFPDNYKKFMSVRILPDKNLWLTGNDRGEIQNWDLLTSQELWKLECEGMDLRVLQVSPTEDWAASIPMRGRVKFWDLKTGEVARELDQAEGSGHLGIPSSYPSFHSGELLLNGKYLVTIESSKRVIVWDTRTLQAVTALNVPGGETYHLAMTPDAQYLVTGGWKSLILWEIATGKMVRKFDDPFVPVTGLAMLPNGIHFAAGSEDGDVRIWNVHTGQLVNKLPLAKGLIDTLHYSKDGTLFIVQSFGGPVQVLDAVTFSVLWKDRLARANSVSLSASKKYLAFSNHLGEVAIRNLEKGYEIARIEIPGRIQQLGFSRDGRRLLGYDIFGDIWVWDSETGREIAQMVTFKNGEWATFTPEGYYTASSGGEQFLYAVYNGVRVEMNELSSTWRKPEQVRRLLAQ